MTPFFAKPPPTAGYVLETSFDGSGSAIFSKDRKHRYALTRSWQPELALTEHTRIVIYCGLNPSKAGASKPDQTISKEIGFAIHLGACALVKVNLFSAVLTQSHKLDEVPELVGPDYAEVMALIEGIAHRRDIVTKTVLAWGSHELATQERITEVLPYLPGPYECYGTTQDGHPRHTSRIAYATPIERWKGI